MSSLVFTACAPKRVAVTAPPIASKAKQRLEEIERRLGGQLGVAVVDTGNERRLAYRDDERFPLCSTFKLLAAGAVLARVDAGTETLERVVPYGEADLLDYAPVTREHVAERGLSVAALCLAAITVSDNTAGNLLLASIGGPAGLTQFVQSLGAIETRLDRTEPTLNEAAPGDPRDTTTPSSMLTAMRALLVGDALSSASRDKLVGWLEATKTGTERLRAGWPTTWRTGDKTGTGERGAANDVAIVWPTGRAPILVAAYSVGSTAEPAQRNAALAEVGQVIAEWSSEG